MMARESLLLIYELIFAPLPSPVVDPDDDFVGDTFTIPLVQEEEEEKA